MTNGDYVFAPSVPLLVHAQPQAFVFESCQGDSVKSELKLAAMKTAVRKHGTSGNCRISLFGTLVGWLHEQSYIPRARKGLNSGLLIAERRKGCGRVYDGNKLATPEPRTIQSGKRSRSPSHLVFFALLIAMQAMDLYLVVMSRIFNGRALQLNARMAKGDGHAYVPLETVAPVVEELLPVMDEVRLKRARGKGVKAGTIIRRALHCPMTTMTPKSRGVHVSLS